MEVCEEWRQKLCEDIGESILKQWFARGKLNQVARQSIEQMTTILKMENHIMDTGW